MINEISKAVEKYESLMSDAYEFVWTHAETGYKEFQTTKYLKEAFEKLGYSVTAPEDITGFYTVIDTGRQGPEVMILGELDALVCPEHPEANKETGVVHCCGHSLQGATLLGIAAALKEPEILEKLSGKIRLCMVPAEELIEIEYRTSLKKEGKIKYMGGKSEFLKRGYFDGVDLAFMVHATTGDGFYVRKGAVGCIAKRVIYKGVSAHAGGCPWDGCNALYAANLGLSAINSIRETFKDSDLIRVHPIITKGGGAVNAIPDNVIIESFVRGASFDAMKSANIRVNRALCGAALSIGANVEINDTPGYAPLNNSKEMIKLAKEAAQAFPDIPFYQTDEIGTGSTDMGDLSTIMPVIHPYVFGATGTSHGSDYKIKDYTTSCVTSAKWQLVMLSLLLKDGGERAKNIINGYNPQFKSKEEYFEFMDNIEREGDCITYSDGNSIQVKF